MIDFLLASLATLGGVVLFIVSLFVVCALVDRLWWPNRIRRARRAGKMPCPHYKSTNESLHMEQMRIVCDECGTTIVHGPRVSNMETAQ